MMDMMQDISEKDKYGRLLRYVYAEDGEMVNLKLVRLGFGEFLNIYPDTKDFDKLKDFIDRNKKKPFTIW